MHAIGSWGESKYESEDSKTNGIVSGQSDDNSIGSASPKTSSSPKPRQTPVEVKEVKQEEVGTDVSSIVV